MTPPVPIYKRTFHPFPSLPPELRQAIWRLAQPDKQRLVRVILHDPDHIPDDCIEAWADVKTNTTLHPLFHVNREARQVFESVFRIHFPCRFGSRGALKTAYFNPDLDIFWVEGYPRNETIRNHRMRWIDFVLELKRRDPLGVGLRRLALDADGRTVTDSIGDPPRKQHSNDFWMMRYGGALSSLDSGSKEAFLQTLRQLQEMYFVHRHINIWGNDTHPGPLFDPLYGMHGPMPLTGYVNAFEIFKPDYGYLESPSVLVDDPRPAVRLWRSFTLSVLGEEPPTLIRIINPITLNISSHLKEPEKLREFLRIDQDEWEERAHIAETHENRAEFKSFDAFFGDFDGFWIWPVEAIGRLPQNPREKINSFYWRSIELEPHQPVLAVFDPSPSRAEYQRQIYARDKALEELENNRDSGSESTPEDS